MSEDMDAGRWCHAYDLRSEGSGRLIDQIGSLGKAYRPPGSPMDGDGTIWASAADRLSRLLGIEMTRTEGGPPTPDRHQGDVDLRHLVERKTRTCVPRIPASVGAGNKIAEGRSAMRAPGVPSAVMVGCKNAYLEAAKFNQITRLDLAKLQTAGGDWLEQPARASRRNENRGGRDKSERGQVCVVGV